MCLPEDKWRVPMMDAPKPSIGRFDFDTSNPLMQNKIDALCSEQSIPFRNNSLVD